MIPLLCSFGDFDMVSGWVLLLVLLEGESLNGESLNGVIVFTRILSVTIQHGLQ